ncbi:MAG: PorT family protein [Draconibacterium sp.]|nr:PorT family protein [Draconibacterium sp.]
MKNYYLIILVLAFIFFSSKCFAQKVELQINFGHYDITEIFEGGGGKKSHRFNANLRAGSVLNFNLKKDFSFRPGLIVGTKGRFLSTKKDIFPSQYIKSNLNIWYADVPLLFRKKIDIDNLNFFAEAGPYFGYGLKGKYHFREYTKYDEIEVDFFKSVGWDNSDVDNLKRLDFGLSAGFGFKLNLFTVGFSYFQGLRNISQLETMIRRNVSYELFVSYSLFDF